MGQSTPATIGSGIEIRLSSIPGGGNGLWTTRLFRRNELITEYCGPIIDHKKALQLRRKNKHSHIRVLNSQFLYIDGLKKPEPGVGGASFANDARNHHRNNSAFVSRHDSKLGRDRVFLKATQELPPGTEVFVSYGNQYWSCSTKQPTSPQKAKQQQQQDLTATGDQGAAVQASHVHPGLAVVTQPAFGMAQQQQQQVLLQPRLRSDSMQQQQEDKQPAVHTPSHLNWPGLHQEHKQWSPATEGHQQQQESGRQPCSGSEPQLQAAAVLDAAAAAAGAAAAMQASTTGALSRLLPSHMQPMQQQQVVLQSMACWSTHWPYLQPPVPYMLPGLLHPPPRAMPVLAQAGNVGQGSLQAYFQQQQQQAFFQQTQQHHQQQQEAYCQQQERQAFFQQKQQQQQQEAYFEQQQQQEQAYLHFQQQQGPDAGASVVQPVTATRVQQADARGTSATRAGPGRSAAAVSALTAAEAAPQDLTAGVEAAAAAVGPSGPGGTNSRPAVAVTAAVFGSVVAQGSREARQHMHMHASGAASYQQQGYWQQPLREKRHSTAIERLAALQPDNPYKKTYKTSAGRKKAGI